MQPGRPKQHTHNWSTSWHAITETAIQTQTHVNETWFGIRVKPVIVMKCIRGNTVKHVIRVIKSLERSTFIPMSGAVPLNWTDGKRIKYE